MSSKGLKLPESARNKKAVSMPFKPMQRAGFEEVVKEASITISATTNGDVFIGKEKFRPDTALVHLTSKLGVSLSEAVDALDTARFKHREERYWLKRADQIPPPPRAAFPILPETVGIGGGDQPGGVTYNMEAPQSAMQALPQTTAPLVNNPNAAWIDPSMGMQQQQMLAPEAPQSGFELTALQALSQTNRIDQPLAKTTSQLLKSTSQWGELLFLLYASPEEFKDRYGKHDTETIENLLITLFETGGDLYVKLRQGEQNPGSSLVSPDGNQPLEER